MLSTIITSDDNRATINNKAMNMLMRDKVVARNTLVVFKMYSSLALLNECGNEKAQSNIKYNLLINNTATYHNWYIINLHIIIKYEKIDEMNHAPVEHDCAFNPVLQLRINKK
jgi:hypothetical protein